MVKESRIANSAPRDHGYNFILPITCSNPAYTTQNR